MHKGASECSGRERAPEATFSAPSCSYLETRILVSLLAQLCPDESECILQVVQDSRRSVHAGRLAWSTRPSPRLARTVSSLTLVTSSCIAASTTSSAACEW